jgi:hypothetical protein
MVLSTRTSVSFAVPGNGSSARIKALPGASRRTPYPPAQRRIVQKVVVNNGMFRGFAGSIPKNIRQPTQANEQESKILVRMERQKFFLQA